MANGTKAFAVAALMALAAVSGSQGQARPIVPDSLPSIGFIAD